MIYYVIVVFLGVIIGSFLNICIDRIPLGERIIFPGSHCESCGHPLGGAELIPIISYFMIKGRCRYCENRISLQYPLIELINGALYVLVYYYFGNTLTTIAYAILFSILLVVTVIDQRTMHIPNSLIIFGLGVSFIYKIALAISVLDIKVFFQGMIGMLVGGIYIGAIMAFSLLIFQKEGIGMGDLKLLAMIGLFTNSRYTLYTLSMAILVGGIYGVLVLIKTNDKIFPFGPFLSIGGAAAILWGDTLWHLYVNYMF